MLEFKDLRAGYDGIERLHGLCAGMHPGRMTAVIGPNGCGKSTLIKCAAGVLRPTSGEICLDGRPLEALPRRDRARLVSYMPQSRLVPDIPVRHLVLHGRYPHLKWGQSPQRADQEIVRAALARVGLDDLAGRSVLNLSGGERQRAYLAMMLAQQTPVMLLDEPTTYLDLSSQFALMNLLRELCDEQRSVIVVLHDLALALEYADDVLLMRAGEAVIQAPAGELYRSGALQDVFNVSVKRLEGGKYLFSPQGTQPSRGAVQAPQSSDSYSERKRKWLSGE